MDKFSSVLFSLCLTAFLWGCTEVPSPKQETTNVIEQITPSDTPFLMVLGIAQDAGYPQAGCKKDCCKPVWKDPAKKKMVSCLGLADPKSGQYWLFDATPDLPQQMRMMETIEKDGQTYQLAGIFLTHAHMGHYTGLLHLGREVMGSQSVPIYAFPRMKSFLEQNGPWSQLVNLKNIRIHELREDSAIILNNRIKVASFLVPHRDEFSETAGFHISGPSKSALFIPDIDKWDRWDQNILDWIQQSDLAFLDGTFFQNGELPGRDMNEIPHPFVEESARLFSELSADKKQQIHFIHFNHTNPLLHSNGTAHQTLESYGMKTAREKQVEKL